MIKNKILYIAGVSALILFGCVKNTAYNSYKGTDVSGWNQDTSVIFDVDITDTVSAYNIILNVRHTTEYPYQNLWMFVRSCSPDGIVRDDTTACFLADNTGKWLGQSYFSVYEMPVMFMDKIRFPKEGVYHFEIYQGMRDSMLKGIRDIGITIEKSDSKDGKE